jgi:hypothetical protein
VRRVRWRAGSLRGVSMTLYLVKMPPDLAARVEVEPNLLNQVWREDDVVDQQVAALQDDDTLMEDYLDLGRMVNGQPGRYPWLEKALHGTGKEIAFEFGYGAGFSSHRRRPLASRPGWPTMSGGAWATRSSPSRTRSPPSTHRPPITAAW